ncbi:MAG: hypothetical protein ACLFVG_07395 [Candidatus Aminicenantes bacterium]
MDSKRRRIFLAADAEVGLSRVIEKLAAAETAGKTMGHYAAEAGTTNDLFLRKLEKRGTDSTE